MYTHIHNVLLYSITSYAFLCHQFTDRAARHELSILSQWVLHFLLLHEWSLKMNKDVLDSDRVYDCHLNE